MRFLWAIEIAWGKTRRFFGFPPLGPFGIPYAEDRPPGIWWPSRDRTEFPWYKETIGHRLSPATEEFYASYAKLSGDELISHLHSIRDRAWPIGKYPSVGSWRFLLPILSSLPQYSSIVFKLQSGATILDLGCGLGQDLRLLAAHGAPTDNMYAADQFPEVWNLGYDLFQDRDRMKAQFIEARGWYVMEKLKKKLSGKVDVILACQFWDCLDHVLGRSVIQQILPLTKVGTMIIGYQIGSVTAYQDWCTPYDGIWYHDTYSFKDWWNIAELWYGGKWSVEAELVPFENWGMEKEDYDWMPETHRGLQFAVTRVG